MCDKVTIDYFDPYKGWIELWKCTRCGKLFPLYMSECPHCKPPRDESKVDYKSITIANEAENKSGIRTS